MPEILPILSKLGGWIKGGTKAVAAGKAQANLGVQSPELPTALTRIGRFLYVATLGWIGISYYTGYVNERTKEGEMKFLLPAGNLPVISPPDRADKTLPGLKKKGGILGGLLGSPGEAVEKLAEPGLPFGITTISNKEAKGRTLVALAPNQLGVPGTAVGGYLWSAPSGQKEMPPFSASKYHELNNIAQRIANKYGLKISSSYRPGSSGSMHSVGLAWDMVGSMNNMKRAASWASTLPGLFQEIFVHNEGSGMHLHIAFYPDAAQIWNNSSRRYEAARNGQNPNPAASKLIRA